MSIESSPRPSPKSGACGSIVDALMSRFSVSMISCARARTRGADGGCGSSDGDRSPAVTFVTTFIPRQIQIGARHSRNGLNLNRFFGWLPPQRSFDSRFACRDRPRQDDDLARPFNLVAPNRVAAHQLDG